LAESRFRYEVGERRLPAELAVHPRERLGSGERPTRSAHYAAGVVRVHRALDLAVVPVMAATESVVTYPCLPRLPPRVTLLCVGYSTVSKLRNRLGDTTAS